jgi:exopolyphosphatase/guanosine-5'-triphosphate,3'-diphosphate pyrophosphatase
MAVIDVGTTAVRMDIAEISPAGDIRTLDSLQRAVNLGKDTFSGRRIKQATIEECVDILKAYRLVMGEYGILGKDQVRAVATSAIMETDNGDAFLDRIYIATRISVVPIEESDVNRLTYVALYRLLEKEPFLKEGNALIIEVGGGDTKVLLIQEGAVTYSGVFRLGALRMKETLEKHRTPSDRIRAVIDQHIERTVEEMQHNIPVDNVQNVIAIAGDMRLAMSKLVPDWKEGKTAKLASGAFSAMEKVAVATADELVRKHRIPYHEAETAGPALLTYVRVARAFKAKQIVVSTLSLRQGLLVDEAGGGLWTESFTEQILHSARSLGEKYGYDHLHAAHVMELSQTLFHELRPEHQMDARLGVLLKVAAILHDIGRFVSTRSHHKHSMYLIQNSDVFGLSREDMLLVALVARYHRRSPPKPAHEGFAVLDREGRIAVSKLAAILRIADALDRRNTQRIHDIVLSREGGRLVITARNVEDVTIERLAMEDKATMFEDVYGRKVILRTSGIEGEEA